MTNTETFARPSHKDSAFEQQPNLENCESILIGLETRRFVVVRTDEPENLWPIAGGWDKLRDLKPGDEVIYKGARTTVRALQAYR